MELVDQLAQRLSEYDFEVCIEFQLSDLAKRISERLESGSLAAVVAAGGDGTVNAIATRTPPQVPIAVLPLGSENLLARYYGWDRSPETCATRIKNGNTVVIDAMEINGQLGLIMVSIGFDSEVVRLVHTNRKSHITRWAYRYQAIKAWLTYRWPAHKIHYRIDNSHQEEIVQGQWIFVFNIPKYATDLHILDNADPSDGLIDLGMFTKSGPIRGLFQYFDALRGRHRQRSDWTERRVTELRCENISYDKGAHSYTSTYQFDGDSGGSMPMNIKVLPKRVKLLC
jgi:diacylglycerol kinase family enzyme